MKTPRILVVGSLNMDQTGKTAVFPSEGETVIGETFSTAPGGKGANQAVQMARLGAKVSMVGKLGRDANGETLQAVLKEAGVDTARMLYDEELSSGSAMIILEENERHQTLNRIIIFPGSNMTITDEEVRFLREEIADFDMLVLQHEIPLAINELVAEYASLAGVPVMLNPAPYAAVSDEMLRKLTFISPNEHEVYGLTGIRIAHEGTGFDKEAARAAAAALRERGAANVLITLGEAGAVLSAEDGEFYHSPCMSGIRAVDSTAAGDSFVGAFSVAVSSGYGYQEALTLANAAAGIAVTRAGALPSLPTMSELTEELKKRHIDIG